MFILMGVAIYRYKKDEDTVDEATEADEQPLGVVIRITKLNIGKGFPLLEAD